MTAIRVPLKIDQGATFMTQVTWKTGTPPTPVNLTDCTALAQIRANIKAEEVLFTLSTADGSIVLGGVNGTITLKISATDTAEFTWKSAVYDLEITFADLKVRRLLCGSVTVSPEVTRD